VLGLFLHFLRNELYNEILAVSTEEAQEMARRLAREEGIFSGTSTGANVLASVEVAKKLGGGRNIVTLAVDSGLKYLSTEVYSCKESNQQGR
jgi:cysteine synthase